MFSPQCVFNFRLLTFRFHRALPLRQAATAGSSRQETGQERQPSAASAIFFSISAQSHP